MALKVSRVEMWASAIADKPGGLAQKLGPLAEAGASFEFVLARRTPEKGKGKGVVFATPVRGAKRQAAAKKAGFRKTRSLHAVRAEGPDKAGLGLKITGALAEAGINVRGLSAVAIGKRAVAYMAFDSAKDAATAARVLRKIK